MNIERLEELARAATPGPWFVHPTLGHAVATVSKTRICADGIPQADPHSDAAYIAACDPSTILKLTAAGTAATELVAVLSEYGTFPPGVLAKLNALRAALEELKP